MPQWMNRYFLLYFITELCNHFGRKVKVKLDLFNICNEGQNKKRSSIDTSTMASKANLADLKTKVDYLDVDKLKTNPVDFTKFSNVVDNDGFIKNVYDKRFVKFSAIDTYKSGASILVYKMQYDLNKKFFNRRLKILTKRLINTSGLVKTKITEIEKKNN